MSTTFQKMSGGTKLPDGSNDGDVPVWDSENEKWIPGEVESANVTYDNTISGLQATDVKSAIDELAGEVVGLNTLIGTGVIE